MCDEKINLNGIKICIFEIIHLQLIYNGMHKSRAPQIKVKVAVGDEKQIGIDLLYFKWLNYYKSKSYGYF